MARPPINSRSTGRPVCVACCLSRAIKRSRVSVDKFEGLRKLAVQAIVDDTSVLRKGGTGHKGRHEDAVRGVPSTGGLIGRLNERMGEVCPVDGIVHQDLEPKDAADSWMLKRLVERGHTKIGRQQFQQLR